MTLSRRRWCLLVLTATVTLSALAALVAGFVPTAADLADPLARPAELTRSVARSTATLDRLSTDIHADHRLISLQSRTATDIADRLDELVGHTEPLAAQSTGLSARTDQLTDDIRALPGLVEVLNGHTVRATAVTHRLGSRIDTVSNRLRTISTELDRISTHLQPLTRRTAAIAELLRRIERHTTVLRPVGPILGRLGR
ncbi:MAG: hypothetical protein ACT4O0_17820 [Pseudonocardia sp.]